MFLALIVGRRDTQSMRRRVRSADAVLLLLMRDAFVRRVLPYSASFPQTATSRPDDLTD